MTKQTTALAKRQEEAPPKRRSCGGCLAIETPNSPLADGYCAECLVEAYGTAGATAFCLSQEGY